MLHKPDIPHVTDKHSKNTLTIGKIAVSSGSLRAISIQHFGVRLDQKCKTAGNDRA